MNTFSTPTPYRHRRNRQRGFSIATLLGLLFVMALVGGSGLALVNHSLRLVRRQTDQTSAFNMADAGVDLAFVWLSTQDPPPLATNLQNMTNFYGTNGTITAPFGQTGSTLQIRISADTTNPAATQKKYLIESKATLPSGATAIVRAYLQQTSFGKYAFFTVNDGDGFWKWDNYFEGPFHSNDADGKPSMILWKPGLQANPMFQYTGADAFSVSGDVTWWKNTIGNTVAPSAPDDYNSLAKGGQQSITTGYKTDALGNFLLDTSGKKIPNSQSIPLPTTDYAQQYAAVGQVAPTPCTSPPTTGIPVANGISFVSGGGLYIKAASDSAAGNNDLTLQVDASGNQQFVLTQGTTVQTVTVYPPPTNQTTIATKIGAAATVTATYSGVPNGMVFSEKTITNLKGTVADNKVSGSGAGATITARSQWTIATNIAAGKDIYLADDLKYNTARDFSIKQTDDTNYNLKAGTLGLLTRNAIIRAGAGSTHGYNLRFDGSIFATNSFYPADYKSNFQGTMTANGGVIVKDSGLFAQADNNGNLTTGYNENYHYDNRFADNPPPYFPTTGTHYDVLSWQRVLQML